MADSRRKCHDCSAILTDDVLSEAKGWLDYLVRNFGEAVLNKGALPERRMLYNAIAEIPRLRAEIDWLREQEAVLTHEAAVQEAEITRLRALLETQK